jgi:hypothetical protein
MGLFEAMFCEGGLLVGMCLLDAKNNISSILISSCDEWKEGFKKNFFFPTDGALKASASSVDSFRQSKEISLVAGENFPNPIIRFSDHKFPSFVTDEIERQGYKEPTAIQAQVRFSYNYFFETF